MYNINHNIENSILKPTFVVSRKICERNIQKMAEKAKKSNCVLRPHFKTHQSAEVGKLFKAAGINKITVSSLSMAEYFASFGWNDILVAFVFNHRELANAKRLSSQINLHLLVDSVETVKFIANNISSELNLYIKIDTGNRRTGIDINDINLLDTLISEISKFNHLKLIGLLGHCGHTYFSKNKNEIIEIWNNTVTKLINLKYRYKALFPELIISLGDTPSCNLVDNFNGIDEVRPGNFVYNDLMQVNLNTCSYNDIAAVVACPVVSKNNSRNEIVIYGGAVHFSKDFIVDNNGNKIFGLVTNINNGFVEPYENCYLISLTQEHGIIRCNNSLFEKTKIGDIVFIIPIHSCLTANQLLNSTLYID